MVKAAGHRDLKKAFKLHERQTRQQVRRLDGTVRTWALLLGRDDHAALLQETLDEESETDKHLTALATSSINLDAKEGDDEK
jgi:ferritin-like metal-binding protein YciE